MFAITLRLSAVQNMALVSPCSFLQLAGQERGCGLAPLGWLRRAILGGLQALAEQSQR